MRQVPISAWFCLTCGQKYPAGWDNPQCVHSIETPVGGVRPCPGPIARASVIVQTRKSGRPDPRSQAGRVLARMERHPSRGVTQVDFDLPDVCDGGPPIKRVAARIDDLEREWGIVVERAGRRDGCTIYRRADLQRAAA